MKFIVSAIFAGVFFCSEARTSPLASAAYAFEQALTGATSQTEANLRQYFENGGTDLNFQISRGANEQNFFLRQGANQSHTVITGGEHAQIVTAFPAGNSSVAFWPQAEKKLHFTMLKAPKALASGANYGVRYTLQVNSPDMVLRKVVVGSTRDTRDYEHSGTEYSDAVVQVAKLDSNRLLFHRQRLDGQGQYLAQITAVGGKVSVAANGQVHLESAAPETNLTLTIDALTSETPDPALPITQIFVPEIVRQMSVEDIQGTLFLMNGIKSLAGSWRYETYFGRDLLLTQIYTAEFLQPEAMEIELAAVFERENAEGDAAHEEDIGDIATRRNIQAGRGATATPLYDYKMVDTAHLVPNFFALYLQKVGNERASAFLDRKTSSGRTLRQALAANLDLVLTRAEPFALHPVFSNLISFGKGLAVGDWRDSNNGHGSFTDQENAVLLASGVAFDRTQVGGRYSFGINVGLVPGALRQAKALFANSRLGLFDQEKSDRAGRSLSVWLAKARPLFQRKIQPLEANTLARAYAARLGLAAPATISRPIEFSALSLDRLGQPIDVMHSDEGFDLLFNEPRADVLDQVADSLLRPFPFGLSLPVGMAVANPVFLRDAVMQARFAPDQYHGFLVWGCEMAKMERGLSNQLRRADLPASTRAHLLAAHKALWKLIDQMKDHRREELWSWTVRNGQIAYQSFKEANALQYWNLALLLLRNPYVNGDSARHNQRKSSSELAGR